MIFIIYNNFEKWYVILRNNIFTHITYIYMHYEIIVITQLFPVSLSFPLSPFILYFFSHSSPPFSPSLFLPPFLRFILFQYYTYRLPNNAHICSIQDILYILTTQNIFVFDDKKIWWEKGCTVWSWNYDRKLLSQGHYLRDFKVKLIFFF